MNRVRLRLHIASLVAAAALVTAGPAKAQVIEIVGTLAIAAAQDHCWMWTYKSAAAVTLQVRPHKQ